MSSDNNNEHTDAQHAGGPLGYWVTDLPGTTTKLAEFEMRLRSLNCEDAQMKHERDAKVEAAVRKALADFHQAVSDARKRLFRVDLALSDDFAQRLTVTLSRPVTIV